MRNYTYFIQLLPMATNSVQYCGEYCTMQYCSMQYCSMQYCSMQYCTMQYCSMQYCSVEYCSLQYCSMQYCSVQYCSLQYCSMHYCSGQYCSVQYYNSVLARLFPKGTVPFETAPKPVMCPLVPPQNQHIFNSHFNYLNVKKTVWALNIELSEH